MNWPVIGLLITLIVILFGWIYVSACTIIRSVDNAKMLMYNLNYYRELANKYGLQLTRIGEGIEEFETFQKRSQIYIDRSYISQLHNNIKSLVKIVGR